jgi:hypothetical protein
VDSDAMNRLYKLGAFEILLWKLLAGDLTDANKSSIVGFIRQSHLLQVTFYVAHSKIYGLLLSFFFVVFCTSISI